MTSEKLLKQLNKKYEELCKQRDGYIEQLDELASKGKMDTPEYFQIRKHIIELEEPITNTKIAINVIKERVT